MGQSVKISVKTVAGAQITIKIYNLTGEYIKTIQQTASVTGWYELYWDVTNRENAVVGRGLYFLHIRYASNQVIRRVFVVK